MVVDAAPLSNDEIEKFTKEDSVYPGLFVDVVEASLATCPSKSVMFVKSQPTESPLNLMRHYANRFIMSHGAAFSSGSIDLSQLMERVVTPYLSLAKKLNIADSHPPQCNDFKIQQDLRNTLFGAWVRGVNSLLLRGALTENSADGSFRLVPFISTEKSTEFISALMSSGFVKVI